MTSMCSRLPPPLLRPHTPQKAVTGQGIPYTRPLRTASLPAPQRTPPPGSRSGKKPEPGHHPAASLVSVSPLVSAPTSPPPSPVPQLPQTSEQQLHLNSTTVLKTEIIWRNLGINISANLHCSKRRQSTCRIVVISFIWSEYRLRTSMGANHGFVCPWARYILNFSHTSILTFVFPAKLFSFFFKKKIASGIPSSCIFSETLL